ncbi:NAD(P)-dependent oxidoreductase [Actinocorallia sp. A-T 12471]|uniref:NAD(P)-dependent oxidoreductase n=1 Tax=Actinocorallia sp. A-T 12471 TaxID=3089813 RepID=UPI0029CEDCA9|nr:NAD(P)-dependent oxidoreductase [Actinocorallia sp. A-T 12471]MDX6742151.1 NAD(P)-dependent oxidoreductase [Actinocorallia sp. A-T 12471]
MSAPLKLGFVGAGRMGGQMVRRLLAAGHEVTVLEASEAARAELAEAGARTTAEVKDLADAQIVGVCVHTDAQVQQVCLDGGLIDTLAEAPGKPGAALVVHTTCSPRTVELLGRYGAQRGVAVVDAAISGGPHDIAAGTLTLFVGGDADAFARVTPFLAAYGDPILHLGALGDGQRVKLLNNAVFAANIGVVGQAVAVAEQLGVSEGSLLKALEHGSGASRALAGIGTRGSVSGFASSVAEFLGKDLTVVRETAADLDADLGALNAAHAVLEHLLWPAEDA